MPKLSRWRFRNAASARGAIVIQVAVAIFVLIGLTAFVIDYGVVWLSRRQAQNAADAGALAGAVARAFDETANPPSAGGAVHQSALLAAQANAVFGAVPGVFVDPAYPCPSFAPANGRCVQVDVHRDGTNGSATLPVFFARVFSGVTSQGVQATASAIVGEGNATNQLRPWMIPDKFSGPHWQPPTPTPPSIGCVASGAFSPPTDTYTAPTSTSPGTGYTASGTPNYIGCRLVLKEGNPSQALSPSFYYEVDVTGGGGGAYKNNIINGAGVTIKIGDQLQTLPGNRQGPTQQGVTALVAKDPTASWNGTQVVNSCAPSCAPLSPRIVPVALFSPQQFHDLNRQSGKFFLTVVNFLGFFVESADNNGTVTGILIQNIGDLVTGTPTVGDRSGFTLTPLLVR